MWVVVGVAVLDPSLPGREEEEQAESADRWSGDPRGEGCSCCSCRCSRAEEVASHDLLPGQAGGGDALG